MMNKARQALERLLPMKLLTGVVLVHNLTQALPWLAAIIASSAAAAYGVAVEQPLLLAAAVALGTSSALTLLINFLVWYFNARRTGWKQRATSSEERLGGQEVLVSRSERMGLALTLIRDLNLAPLEITDPQRRDEQTREWLTRYMMPAMSKISSGTGIGLLEWNWVEGRQGEYRLAYDSGVPEIVRSVLPKTTSRDFITCLAILQLRRHHSVAISDERGGASRAWIVAFLQEDLDLAAEAVFSTGARIVSDAWRGADPKYALGSA
jgi:membrane protein implicated in regulation of membrane protease activity